MTIRLDHTIVPAKDKVAAAEFFADIFGARWPSLFLVTGVNTIPTQDTLERTEPCAPGGIQTARRNLPPERVARLAEGSLKLYEGTRYWMSPEVPLVWYAIDRAAWDAQKP